MRLLRRLNDRFAFEMDTHPAVEATLFHQPTRSRYLLSLINFQKDLPNIPIDNIRVTLRLPASLRRITLLLEGQTLSHHSAEEGVTFAIPRVTTLAMVAIETKARVPSGPRNT